MNEVNSSKSFSVIKKPGKELEGNYRIRELVKGYLGERQIKYITFGMVKVKQAMKC